MLTRRSFLAATLIAGALPGPLRALEPEEAQAHVEGAIDDIVKLMTGGGSAEATAAGLAGVMERRLSMPSVARFVLGRPWREMSAEQQAQFTRAFTGSVARTYARRFAEFDVEEAAVRQTIFVLGAEDAGRKGILVKTEIRPPDLAPVKMDYLVSDRPGKVAIVDVVIEGVSTAITQRDIIAGMLDARDGDVSSLISDLDNL
ncbi:MAG: ABC transporter substrate-binding protein [Pseudomonadota bacterium]